MADVIERPWISRERLYAEFSDEEGGDVSLSAVRYAFAADGLPQSSDDRTALTWSSATIESGTNGTSRVRTYLLVGPTTDGGAVALARGTYRWLVEFTLSGTGEVIVRHLTLKLV